MSFLIYHSGFVTGIPERAYAGRGTGDGIDTLIRSLLENGVKPNSNVYAELGSTWRFLMREPDGAAHALGKLIKYCGENNVLWGTDPSGTARHRTRSRRFALSRSPPNCAHSTATPRSPRRCARKSSG